MEKQKIKVGVSTCLLGENVRYDGGHKRDRFITGTLSEYFEFVPVCPEYECGLGIPRESMHLEVPASAPRLVTSKTRRDMTDQMTSWAEGRLVDLEKEDLCGFIFKSKSPSSGMERIKVFTAEHQPAGSSAGVWARMYMEHFPLIPVEDEGRLNDPALRENFIERVFVMKRFRAMLESNPTPRALVDFHTRHKLIFMAHDPVMYKKMGAFVADAGKLTAGDMTGKYLEYMTGALSTMANPGKNTNVLNHILGYFKDELSSWEKAELIDQIEKYHKGFIPLIVPVTLFNHYTRKYKKDYLKDQYYLDPHPVELKLRSWV